MSFSDLVKKGLRAVRRELFSGSKWVEVHVSPNYRPEETYRRFSYLRSRGVRCQLLNKSAVVTRGPVMGSVILRVHRDDVVKARQLLSGLQN